MLICICQYGQTFLTLTVSSKSFLNFHCNSYFYQTDKCFLFIFFFFDTQKQTSEGHYKRMKEEIDLAVALYNISHPQRQHSKPLRIYLERECLTHKSPVHLVPTPDLVWEDVSPSSTFLIWSLSSFFFFMKCSFLYMFIIRIGNKYLLQCALYKYLASLGGNSEYLLYNKPSKTEKSHAYFLTYLIY